jgi:hypothetical protein
MRGFSKNGARHRQGTALFHHHTHSLYLSFLNFVYLLLSLSSVILKTKTQIFLEGGGGARDHTHVSSFHRFIVSRGGRQRHRQGTADNYYYTR